MEAGFAELAALYEIASLDFPGSEKGLFREVVEKASRLFGVRRVILLLHAGAGGRACLTWGCSRLGVGDYRAYVERNRSSPEAYARELSNGVDLGLLYLEKKGGFSPREERLLDIFSRRLADVLQAHYLQDRVRRANERFKVVVENSPMVAVVGLDNRGKLAQWNREAEELFGIVKANRGCKDLLRQVVPRDRFKEALREVREAQAHPGQPSAFSMLPGEVQRWFQGLSTGSRERLRGLADVVEDYIEDIEATPNQAVRDVEAAIDEVEDYYIEATPIEETLIGDPTRAAGVSPNEVRPGTPVYIPRFKSRGEVLGPPDANGEVQVQLGMMKVTLPISDLVCIPQPNSDKPPILPASGGPKEVGASSTNAEQLAREKAGAIAGELDLRGLTVDEALMKVNKYLDDAYLAGLPRARLIHGKGTGALRQAIRSFLKSHPYVREFKAGEPGEGGDGATIVELCRA